MHDDKKIIIANWKMKLGIKETASLTEKIKDKFKDFKGAEIALCPNFISMLDVKLLSRPP